MDWQPACLPGSRGISPSQTGRGRCDLFVGPVSRRKEAFIVEFKVTKKLGELEARADEALAQIEDRNYAKELPGDNYSVISRYGIAVCGKECMVKLAACHSPLT